MVNINRNNFHHNFLKSIAVRLDLQGVMESEMEKVLVPVKDFAKERGFSRYSEKISNQKNLSATDERIKEVSGRSIYQKVHSFIDEKRGFMLDVSNNLINLTINTTHYIPFEEYSSIVPLVSEIYKDNLDFFSVTRFGIRKMNECLIKDKSQIRRYFNPVFFGYYDSLERITPVQSSNVNVFTRDEYRVNLMTNILKGQFKGDTVYSVRLDIDAYVDNVHDVLALLDKHEKLSEINDMIFEIYTSALTDKFISMLSSDEDFNCSDVFGVERND